VARLPGEGIHRLTIPADYYLQPLSWRQVSARPERYQLRAIGSVLGTLDFEGSRTAIARTAHAVWRFQPSGILHPRIEILLQPAGRCLGRFRPHFWRQGGLLEVPPNRVLRVAASVTSKSLSVRGSGGQEVLSYDLRGLAALHAALRWGAEPGAAEELAWLVYFSWYLAVRHFREALAASAIVTGS
jgi:hypothetical protein